MTGGVRHVIYLAAHGGFAGQPVPLGGGAAVANLLAAEWERTRPFSFEVIGPSVLGPGAPSARELIAFREREYAEFCVRFSEAATAHVLRHDPHQTAVLVNDVAEGPDFARLAAAGFRIVTLYHVDVVAYIADIYLRGWIGAPALARAWELLRKAAAPIAPRILRLIFEQQRNSLLHSARVVAPSRGVRGLLAASYPSIPASRLETLNWGAPDSEPFPGARAALEREYGLPPDAKVLVCLSRLSPEKGHPLLLKSLLEAERAGRLPQPLSLFICGEAAFMQGARYAARLRELASRFRKVRVVFPGYAAGKRKRMFLEAADLYVFPSRHESYGLTLTEALAAGAPAIALDHAGARDILTPGCGIVIPREPRAGLARRLSDAITELLADPERRARMSAAAREWAARRPFGESAARLAHLLQAV